MARILFERGDESPEGEVVRRLAAFLDESVEGPEGECAPPIDVVEHGDRVQITVDVPGVARAAIRVVYANGALVIAGRKLPPACNHSDAAFHLAERSFGRFVRAVALTGAFDAGRATASLSAGELRVMLPRIEERRGRDISIEVTGH